VRLILTSENSVHKQQAPNSMKLPAKLDLYSRYLIFMLCICSAKSILANNDIVLDGTDDRQHAISDYIGKGKWTLVNLWGVHCPPCREEMPELVLLHDTYGKTLVGVLGIAIDFPSFGYPDKSEVSDFMQEFLMDFPVLLSDASIGPKLGGSTLQGLPTSYLFTPAGELVAQQLGEINQQIILDFIKKHIEKQKFAKSPANSE